jgi:tetratricopeptide (TPR) repeat protein
VSLGGKLEQLARGSDRELAGKSLLNAALCCLLLERMAPALDHARTALELIPDDEIAWNIMIGVLLMDMQFSELKQLLARKAERFPSPLNHLNLGEVHLNYCEFDSAEQHFRAGLNLTEKDLNCTLGLVAVHLAQFDKADHLAEAERWLQKAEAILGDQKNAHYSLLMGIHRGLQGDALHSRLYLRQALAIDPALEAAKTALQAVSP